MKADVNAPPRTPSDIKLRPTQVKICQDQLDEIIKNNEEAKQTEKDEIKIDDDEDTGIIYEGIELDDVINPRNFLNQIY